jgi:hypothetical protein
MNRKQVLLLLALGAIIAWLLYKGPGVVATQVVAAASDAIAYVMRKLGKAEAARRETLIGAAKAALDGLREELERDHGIQTFIGQTRRTPAEQAIARAENKSDTDNTWHFLDRAIDLYPIGPDGKPDHNAKLPDSVWLQMHRTAAAWAFTVPFRDLATGKRKYLKNGNWDGGHIEYREGLTFAQAERIKGSIA